MPQPPALIIIDMQHGMQSATLPPRNNPTAENMIARLHATWRAAGYPVVSVRHISRSPDSVFAPGQSGVEFQPRFHPMVHEHVVEKNVPDAFIHTGLERWLHARGITHLVSDATFTFDKTDFGGTHRSAEDVHLMALANLHGEYAEVMSCDDLLRRYAMGIA
jgi:nicotinamidase-related amidase